jgi:hypothetical protein
MGSRRVAVTVLGLALAWSARAGAQADEPPRLDEYTAFTVKDDQIKLGLLAFEYGLTDWFSIGTDTPAWAARAFVSIFAPNLHLKLTFLAHERWRLTGQVGGYIADVTGTNNAQGTVYAVPLSLLLSTKLADKWWTHFEGNYNFTHVDGTGSANRFNIDGAVSTESAQVGAMLEFRPIPKLAITLRGRYQAWMSPLSIRGESQLDPYTRADLRAEMTPRYEHPYTVVASVSYFWKHVHARVGGGYGTYFLQGANLYLPYRGFIPDGTISLVF